MHPYDLKDLIYLIKQHLKRVREAMKNNVGDEGSTSNMPQSIVGQMIHGGTNANGPRAPLFAPDGSPIIPQMDPSIDIHTMGASTQVIDYRNYSTNIPQSPPLSELQNWNNDDVVTLLDDLSLNNINVQDPKHNNNN